MYRPPKPGVATTMSDDDNLSDIANPCAQVRRSCRVVVQRSKSVSINSTKLAELAYDISSCPSKKFGEWDAEQWHYTGKHIKDESQRRECMALYVLALDAINFCFWPSSTSLEYEHLATALARVCNDDSEQDDEFALSPRKLAYMTESEFTSLLQPHLQGHDLPNAKERARLWNELGAGLLTKFGGSAIEFISKANSNAVELVKLLISNFPGFRDESIYNIKGNAMQVFFYKRAQIAVGDLNAALQLNLAEMDQLTMFADYRVPQILHHYGILQYSKELSEKIQNELEIPAHAEEEVSIRAATICAVEQLVQKLNTDKITDVTLDWYLWQLGEELHQSGQLQMHHKTTSIFY